MYIIIIMTGLALSVGLCQLGLSMGLCQRYDLALNPSAGTYRDEPLCEGSAWDTWGRIRVGHSGGQQLLR